ncbi:MAG: zinc metalloprotease HtpX [Actinobacteria bacterium]|nr:zinc metalloprotease HtpX [Actinomycetota bacterium]
MYNQIDLNKRKTVFLIGSFLIFIIILGWIFSRALNNPLIVPLAVIISILMSLGSYWYSDRVALAISGAKEVAHNDNPELYHIVENLCITAGLPVPKIYLIQDAAPNAFATGRDPEHSVVAVTTGLLERLNRTELEGVISHELSHIGNYDIRLMTIVVVLVGLVALMSDFFIRFTWFGGRGRDREEGGGQLQIILFIVGFVLALISPLAATLIQLAISRKREFLADANGALLTRYPEGLASALEKISSDSHLLRRANKATAHLYIENPLKERKGLFNGLFNTHPPVEERITKLRAMI